MMGTVDEDRVPFSNEGNGVLRRILYIDAVNIDDVAKLDVKAVFTVYFVYGGARSVARCINGSQRQVQGEETQQQQNYARIASPFAPQLPFCPVEYHAKEQNSGNNAHDDLRTEKPRLKIRDDHGVYGVEYVGERNPIIGE